MREGATRARKTRAGRSVPIAAAAVPVRQPYYEYISLYRRFPPSDEIAYLQVVGRTVRIRFPFSSGLLHRLDVGPLRSDVSSSVSHSFPHNFSLLKTMEIGYYPCARFIVGRLGSRNKSNRGGSVVRAAQVERRGQPPRIKAKTHIKKPSGPVSQWKRWESERVEPSRAEPCRPDPAALHNISRWVPLSQ